MERQFVESMKRLFDNARISKEKILELFENGKITEQEKLYILNNV